MDAQFYCPHCSARWDIRSVDCIAVANAASLFEGVHQACRASGVELTVLRTAEAVTVEALEWTLNLTNGRLIGSHAAADASLPLYQVWHDGDRWLGATMHAPLVEGSITECIDACQEHFSDARSKDAEAVR